MAKNAIIKDCRPTNGTVRKGHKVSIIQALTVQYICSAQSENLDNSGIALRKVRIPKLADRVRILTWRGTIPELSVRKVRIGTK